MPATLFRPRIMTAALAVCVSAAAFAACGGPGDPADRAGEGPGGAPRADEVHAGEDARAGGSSSAPLVITEDAQRNAGVRVVTAEHRELPVPMEVTGFVTPDTTRVMRLRALAEGGHRPGRREAGRPRARGTAPRPVRQTSPSATTSRSTASRWRAGSGPRPIWRCGGAASSGPSS